MKRIYDISGYVVAALLTLMLALSCHYNPLDSYSRIPPDRSEESDDDNGGLGGAFASGFGTPESPYILATAQHVANMPKALSPEEMVYFKLSADIDMKDVAWVPLNNAEPYSLFVDFDGDGHVIKNLSCKGQSYSSFFGILCGECRNVGFIDATISGSNASGVIAGYLGIRSPKSSNFVGSVTGCYVSGSVSGAPAGGIAGMTGTAYSPRFCEISNCYSAARVSSSGEGGGIVGKMLDGGVVTNVYATGRITADKNCGGIAGYVSGSSYLQNVVAWNSAVSGSGSVGLVSSNGQGYSDACTYAKTLTDLQNPDGKTDEELRGVVAGWGDPWATDGAAANGYPALGWLAARKDIADVCGHVKGENPDAPITPEEIKEGSGTEADPYLLRTAGQVFNIKSVLKKGETVHVRLDADVDLKKQKWTPLNFEDPYDLGIHFDGGGHKIANFSCYDATNYASFFGVLNGVCENVEFVDATVLGVSGNCGLLGGWLGTNGGIKAEVSNVKANVTVTNEAAGEVHTGGLAGVAANATLRDCSVSVNVISDVIHDKQKAACGGILGKTNAGVTISGCSVSGKVTNNKGKYTGGIIGWESVGDANVTGCEVKATVSGDRERVGGIIGHFQGGVISRCLFSGDVSTGDRIAGGIVGLSEGVRKDGSDSEISDCISTGSVIGKYVLVGGIAGDVLKKTVVTRCLSDARVEGQAAVGGLVGRACGGGWKYGETFGVKVTKCLAWNGSVTGTRNDNDYAGASGNGAVIGFTALNNTLEDCLRKPGFVLKANYCSDLYDQENAGPSSPLVITGTPAGYNYIYPYHGKAAPAGSTASSAAQSLGWDTSVWDFSKAVPSLKK
mgnify:CR=1 FL=1